MAVTPEQQILDWCNSIGIVLTSQELEEAVLLLGAGYTVPNAVGAVIPADDPRRPGHPEIPTGA